MQQELPGMPSPGKPPRKKRPAAEKPQWSGPIPGQTVMHPRRLGELSYGVDANEVALGTTAPESRHMEVDPHGFVQQVHDVSGYSKQFQDLDLDRGSINLYSTHGGGVRGQQSVRDHWVKQPLAQVRTDSPLHTTQSYYDTDANPGVDAIVRDLSLGGKINQPVWLARDKGKLFVLDGHHRITAARKAGLSHVPARIWDRDAETGWKP